jgi:hypothetical protein
VNGPGLIKEKGAGFIQDYGTFNTVRGRQRVFDEVEEDEDVVQDLQERDPRSRAWSWVWWWSLQSIIVVVRVGQGDGVFLVDHVLDVLRKVVISGRKKFAAVADVSFHDVAGVEVEQE